MLSHRPVLVTFILITLALPLTASAADPAFAPLFNGKDLTGWQMVGPQTWRAKDGILICGGGDTMGWLRSDAQYRDFVLRFEYKLDKGGNSGVFLRAAKDGDPSSTGMQIQIWDDVGRPLDAISCGAVSGSAPPTLNASKPAGEWNTMEISCIGSMITVRHNGHRVLRIDLTDQKMNSALKPEYRLDNRLGPGYIGLQNHKMPVEFRNIRIRRV